MLSVYYQILRVASTREQAMSLGRSGSQAMRMWRNQGGGKSGGAAVRSSGKAFKMMASAPLRSVHVSSDQQLAKCQQIKEPNGRSLLDRAMKIRSTEIS